MNFNNSNISSDNERNSVIIPIDPEVILKGHLNMEISALMQEGDYNNTTGVIHELILSAAVDDVLLGSENENEPKTPPGMTTTTLVGSKQTTALLYKNNNNKHQNGNNSNGNEYLNNNTTSSPDNNKNKNNFSDYSQSPFNPLAMTSFSDFDTPAINSARDENKNNNEELSLASNHFKRFVDETIKRVSDYSSGNKNNNIQTPTGLRARLIIPNCQDNKNSRWGLKISGSRDDLVQAAKTEIIRTPSFKNFNIEDSEDEVEREASMRTSRTIETLLFEDEDNLKMNNNNNTNNNNDLDLEIESSDNDTLNNASSTIKFPVLASLSGPLLGPNYHVIKDALVDFDCIITWNGSLSLIDTNSTLNLHVTGSNPGSISSVVQLLKFRSDRLDEIPLAMTTLVIDSGKLDWIYSSGAIKHVEEALWRTGATLTHLSESFYQVTCLSEALLSSCLKRLHVILSRHQSAHFTFLFRNDFRDFSTKCAGVLESLAQFTDCVVSHRSFDGGVVVEIGGNAGDLARALIRLDTYQSQIFEINGSQDLILTERRLRLHVQADIREFICGKKDGKLNRIIKETGVNISLNMIGGDSMYIDILSEDQSNNFGSNSLLQSLRLISGELPAELTFHVPEIHHKRMIGHGGKFIQRIMKKWGVYVKFMNNHETAQSHKLSDPLVGDDHCSLYKPLDNVIVRTPTKNSSALQAIKKEIFEECSVSEVTGQFDLDAYDNLKNVQGSSKTRVSISLPPLQQYPTTTTLPNILRLIQSNPGSKVDSFLFIRSDVKLNLIVLEGDREDITEIISILGIKLKSLNNNEIFEKEDEIKIIVKSPININSNSTNINLSPKLFKYSNSSFNSNSNSSLSDASFKFFPSALFVIQSHPSISAGGSPILSNESFNLMTHSPSFSDDENIIFPSPGSSVTMNSLNCSINSSPPLTVGHQKQQQKLVRSQSDELNFALAETRRRSADIF